MRIKCNPFVGTSEISVSLNQMLFSYKRINKIITSIRSIIILCKDFSLLDIISLSFRNPPDEVPKGKTSDISNVSKLIIASNCLIINKKVNKKLIKQALKKLVFIC